MTDARYHWAGNPNFVRLDPDVVPAHIFRVHRPDARSDGRALGHGGTPTAVGDRSPAGT